MPENLDLHFSSGRPLDTPLVDLPADLLDLRQTEFASQHHRIGIGREKLHGPDVRDVLLGGDMHLQSPCPRSENHGNVRRDDRTHSGLDRLVEQVFDGLQIMVVHDGIDRQIRADAPLPATLRYFRQVLCREIDRRAGTHIELSYTEIYRIRTGIQGCLQRFVIAGGRHQFQRSSSFHLHRAKGLPKSKDTIFARNPEKRA